MKPNWPIGSIIQVRDGVGLYLAFSEFDALLVNYKNIGQEKLGYTNTRHQGDKLVVPEPYGKGEET